MNTVNPLAAATAAATPKSPAGANPTSINDLGPNAFITLLTAQLQAQDPLNPMDPNQMVTELTSMNTLQEIIQIRQDMDTLATPPAPTAPIAKTAPTGAAVASATSGASASSGAKAAASNALAAGLEALTKSLAPAPAANFSVPVSSSNFKSHLF